MISRTVSVYNASEFDKIKEDELAFWQSKTSLERVAAVEHLRQEYIHQLIRNHKAIDPDEGIIKGLQRSVTIISTK